MVEFAKRSAAPDGPEIEVTDARGARRVGLIWMLVVSTTLAIIVLMGLWAMNSRQAEKLDQPGVATAEARQTASQPPAPGS